MVTSNLSKFKKKIGTSRCCVRVFLLLLLLLHGCMNETLSILVYGDGMRDK